MIETDSHNRITSTLSNKLWHVAMSELADRNLLPLIYTLLQAERIGEEFKHAVWVWKGGIFWLNCGALCLFEVCVEGQTINQFLPVWSTAARGKPFSAFLHPLPPPEGNSGSAAAKSLTPTCSASLQTAVPTVAPWKIWLFGFPLVEI